MVTDCFFCMSWFLINPQVIKGKKNQRLNFSKNDMSVLSHVTFYLEDDDHKPYDFNRKTTSFTCHLLEK